MKEININNFDEKLYYEKLDNDFEVYLFPSNMKKNYFCMLVVRYGGRNLLFKVDNKEYETPTGIAHFLEHKLFEREKETPFEFFSKTGTDVNASTTSDYTNYYIFGNNDFNNNLKYLLNWITSLEIDDEKVVKEQGIILEEASMYKDVPDRILYEHILSNVFVNDSRKYKIIGTDNDIKRITKEDLELCYNAFYQPNNMFLVAAGNINPKEVMDIVKKQLKDFKNKLNVQKIEIEEPDKVSIAYEEIKMGIELPRIGISFKINKDRFKHLNLDNYTLDYYIQMLISLGFGTHSNFRESLSKENLFVGFSSQISDTNTHYLIDFYASSNNTRKLLDKTLDYIKDIIIDENDFNRLKKIWISSEIRISDSLNSIVYNAMDDILDYNEYKNEKIKDIKNLNFETLKKVKEVMDFNNYTTVEIK